MTGEKKKKPEEKTQMKKKNPNAFVSIKSVSFCMWWEKMSR